MLKKDTFLAGFIVGLFLPVMVFIILNELGTILLENGTMNRTFSVKFMCIISIFANIIPFIFFNKAEKGNAMRGIMTITFTFSFIVVLYLYFSGSF